MLIHKDLNPSMEGKCLAYGCEELGLQAEREIKRNAALHVTGTDRAGSGSISKRGWGSHALLNAEGQVLLILMLFLHCHLPEGAIEECSRLSGFSPILPRKEETGLGGELSSSLLTQCETQDGGGGEGLSVRPAIDSEK